MNLIMENILKQQNDFNEKSSMIKKKFDDFSAEFIHNLKNAVSEGSRMGIKDMNFVSAKSLSNEISEDIFKLNNREYVIITDSRANYIFVKNKLPLITYRMIIYNNDKNAMPYMIINLQENGGNSIKLYIERYTSTNDSDIIHQENDIDDKSPSTSVQEVIRYIYNTKNMWLSVPLYKYHEKS